MKSYIEDRAINVAKYIISHNATVRQTAKKFGISKSMVQTEVSQKNVFVCCEIADKIEGIPLP